MWLVVKIIPLPESLVLEKAHITHFLHYIFRNKGRKKGSCQAAFIFSMRHMHMCGTEYKDMWQSRQIEISRIEQET